MTNEIKKELSRPELVYALAAHIRSTSPIPYHEIIKWPTECLRRLLTWYEQPDESIGTFLQSEKDKTEFTIFLWPLA